MFLAQYQQHTAARMLAKENADKHIIGGQRIREDVYFA